MRERTLIGPADWLRLRRNLGLTEPDKERLLPMLGLRIATPVIGKHVEAPPQVSSPASAPATKPTPIPERTPARQEALPTEKNLAWIEEYRAAPAPTIPTGFSDAAPMPVEPSNPPAMSALDPLFNMTLERTLLIAALAKERKSSEIDLAELVRRAGQLHQHRRLPRLVRKTLRLGCQIIFDQSEVMELFFEDQLRLIEHVRAIVQEGRLSVVSTPLGAPDVDRWDPPDPGQPVLALTDLGTTRTFVPRIQRGPAAWLDIAKRAHQRGSDLIVFFTGRRRAVPRELGRLALIIPWDHDARTGDVDRRRKGRLQQ